MCFFTELKADAATLKQRFKASFKSEQEWNPKTFNGFEHPYTPIVLQQNNREIQLFQWGLLPKWSKNKAIQLHTLNARLESIHQKPSFAPYVQQRCLIPATGFNEWQWQDSKGKNKTKYFIQAAEIPIFCFAGIYNIWLDPKTGLSLPTYTLLTTAADELMSKIHNTKRRMPFIIDPSEEQLWLDGSNLDFKPVVLHASMVLDQTPKQSFLDF